MFEAITRVDFAVLDYINENIVCPFLDAVMPVITLLGEGGVFWICTALAMLFFEKTRKAGLGMAIAMILGLIVCNLALKPIVARVRPYDVNSAVSLIVRPLSDYSFPSGHTLVCIECAGVLWHFNKKIGIAAFIVGSLVAFSRLYLYLHYPSDVVFSVALGLIFAFISIRLSDIIYRRFSERKQN